MNFYEYVDRKRKSRGRNEYGNDEKLHLDKEFFQLSLTNLPIFVDFLSDYHTLIILAQPYPSVKVNPFYILRFSFKREKVIFKL